MRILLAEHDLPLATFITKGLQAEHYAVDGAESGIQAVEFATGLDYDLMLLDLNFASPDSRTVLRQVRGRKPELLVLLIASTLAASERAELLDSGADDLILKPLSFAELAAKVRALLRRKRLAARSLLTVGAIKLDRAERRVERAGELVELTNKEFALLEFLMRNVGRRLTRAMIIEHVWDLSFDATTNVVDVYINYLRRKLELAGRPPLIRTIRGVGYEMVAPQESAA